MMRRDVSMVSIDFLRRDCHNDEFSSKLVILILLLPMNTRLFDLNDDNDDGNGNGDGDDEDVDDDDDIIIVVDVNR